MLSRNESHSHFIQIFFVLNFFFLFYDFSSFTFIFLTDLFIYKFDFIYIYIYSIYPKYFLLVSKKVTLYLYFLHTNIICSTNLLPRYLNIYKFMKTKEIREIVSDK